MGSLSFYYPGATRFCAYLRRPHSTQSTYRRPRRSTTVIKRNTELTIPQNLGRFAQPTQAYQRKSAAEPERVEEPVAKPITRVRRQGELTKPHTPEWLKRSTNTARTTREPKMTTEEREFAEFERVRQEAARERRQRQQWEQRRQQAQAH